ncbi:MAG: signal peptidase I [Candidatus Eisenbacteria bacterium]|nr:signal peptidase I [Candidatus Eisenbacteria bacterium]MCC7143625.1 signal peptidase I [Candidatus Eisenbacteria bacterium]
MSEKPPTDSPDEINGSADHQAATEPTQPASGLLRVTTLREVLVALLLLLLGQTGLVQAFNVPTGSMEKAVLPGDFVLADKLTLGPRTPHWIGIPGTSIGRHLPAVKLPGLREPERGDIVVAEVPIDPQTPYLKRVVAVGGDTVEIRDKRLYVNHEAAPEPRTVVHGDGRLFRRGMLQGGILEGRGNRDNFGPYVVPDGSVFLMGDNRDYSLDSRFFGPVAERNIIGRARWITFSVDAKAESFDPRRRVRWQRCGTPLD